MKYVPRSPLAVATAVAIAAAAASAVVTAAADRPQWKAPARVAGMKNPVSPDATSISAGKALFTRECASCHGDTGRGNGPDAAELSLQPPDFASPAVSDQSDGELFWKMTEGRKPMPRYGRLLHDDDRWNLVNYIRSLARGAHG